MTEHRVADIEALMITLHINGQQALFLLLARDGTVNRSGSGTLSNVDADLYIGRVTPTLLNSALAPLTDDMLAFMGGYDIADKSGAECRLSIGLQFKDSSTNGFGFTYGAESQGPPTDIAQFVKHVVGVSEPWYQGQRRLTRKVGSAPPGAPPKKRWWSF
jgi:hypothetical protein